MSQNIVFNGLTYTIPDVGDESWGQNLTSYFIAIPQGALQKSGGLFSLTANVNFGPNFGLLSSYFQTRTSFPATVGTLRLSVVDSVGWRANANARNLLLSISAFDQLEFDGNIVAIANQTIPGLKFDTSLSAFGVAPVAQQHSSGARTAGPTYTATEQTMIQQMYDALRAYGLLS